MEVKGRMKKLSIIIPVYNAEKYLKECIESILNQDYKNLELILVDNNSTDTSPDICREYTEKDNRVFLYYENRSGAAYTRNRGIAHATGDYITFVDSDDYVERWAYETLLKRIEETESDIVCYSFNVIDEKKEKRGFYEPNLKRYLRKCVYSGLEAAKIYITSDDIGGFGWNKIYKMSYFLKCGFQFDENKKAFEDMVPVFLSIINSDRVTFCPVKPYYYRQVKSSLTNTDYGNKGYEFNDSVQQIVSIALNKGLYKEVQIYKSYISALINWQHFSNKEYKLMEWPMGKLKTLRAICAGYRSEKVLWIIKLLLMYMKGAIK